MKWILLLVSLGLASCQKKVVTEEMASPTLGLEQMLDRELAARIFDLPVHCLTQEYPNKLGQVLGSDADLKAPRILRPIFYGCFDWHSSVHGYWTIVQLLKHYPELDATGEVRALLERQITVENVNIEIDFFRDVNNTGFERTYGWAWMLALQKELTVSEDEQFQRWGKILRPLSELIIERYSAYLPKLVYPIRTGQHDNSAFSLSLALDFARAVQNTDFEALLIDQSKRLFGKDVNCPLTYEPSGYDFLSPCLEEALLFSKILNAEDYRVWLSAFLPELSQTNFNLEPATVLDRTDGKLVHLDGLNFSRANCLKGIAKRLPEFEYLEQIANRHFEYSIKNIANDDYMGSHWLGTFALLAILSH